MAVGLCTWGVSVTTAFRVNVFRARPLERFILSSRSCRARADYSYAATDVVRQLPAEYLDSESVVLLHTHNQELVSFSVTDPSSTST
jgi:hypothetical protein